MLVAPVQPWDALICLRLPYVSACYSIVGRNTSADVSADPLPPGPNYPCCLWVSIRQICWGSEQIKGPVSFLRRHLRLGETDVLVLWLGRLSFLRGLSQGMFIALSSCTTLQRRLHFVMAGWFPEVRLIKTAIEELLGAMHRTFIHFLDMKTGVVRCCWAAANLFLSLVINPSKPLACRR